MNRPAFLLVTFCFCCLSSVSLGQLSISNLNTGYTITFDATLAGVNEGAFTGSGFAPAPSSGQIDSDAFASSGMSDGDLVFGGTANSGDYARGSSVGGETTGGFYAFSNGSNPFLGFQPGGSDMAPGTITLRIQNNSGATITDFSVSYKIMEYNDQGRSNSLNFSYSDDNVNFTSLVGLNFSSTEAASGSPAWVSHDKMAMLTGQNVQDGDFFYIRWETDDVSGSGSRDELGIDEISITASADYCQEPASQPTTLVLTPGYTTVNGTFTTAMGTPGADGYLILRSTAASPGCLPVDGTTYSTGESIGSCTVVASGTSTGFSDAGLTLSNTYYYFIFSYSSTGTLICPNYLTTSPLQGSATLNPPNIWISELDADTYSTDTEEFVELSGNANTSLNGLVLVFFNGSNDQSYYALDLDIYSLNSSGFFVAGNAAVSPTPAAIFNNDLLQNGADAVALYAGNASDFPNGTLVTMTNLVDAIVYDTDDADDAGLLAGLGETIQYNENENNTKDISSISFIGGSYQISNPTPWAPNTPLPVEWVDFKARLMGNSVWLNWETATETNSDRFEIEHKIQGGDFVKLGAVLANGYSSSISRYEYVDTYRGPGRHYYRLKQLDINGGVSFSPVVSVHIEDAGSFVLFPQPVKDELVVMFTNPATEKIQLELFDAAGKQLRSIFWEPGTDRFSLPVSDLPKGVYFLRINTGRILELHRLLKQ